MRWLRLLLVIAAIGCQASSVDGRVTSGGAPGSSAAAGTNAPAANADATGTARPALGAPCPLTSRRTVAPPGPSPDLLVGMDRARWDAHHLAATGVTFDESQDLRQILYGADDGLRPGITSVRFGRQRRLAVSGDDCAIDALRPALEPLDIILTETAVGSTSVPLTPDFEPIWRCAPDDVLERPTDPGQPSIRLTLAWGTDQTGTFLHGELEITNNGPAPLPIAGHAVALDVYEAGTSSLAGRFTTWIEPGGSLPPLGPGASITVEVTATSATAACRSSAGQHLPPDVYDAVLALP